MPSPFPGMDPYLENPELWPDVHHELISQIRSVISQKIRPKYVARVELRIYMAEPDEPGQGPRIPDLKLEQVQANGSPSSHLNDSSATSGLLMVLTKFTEEIKEPRLEIFTVAEKRLVTVLEILSPSNKRPGSRGQREFLDKRREIMDSESNWVELDLLRGGQPTFSREHLPICDYLVHVSREQQRPKGQVWPIRLPHPLPVISIPLLPEDNEPTIDLGAILRAAYETAGYDLSIDYDADPIPPLKPEAAAWADAMLKEKGLR